MSETEARSVAEKVAAARNASNEISEAWLCNMALDGPDDFGYIVRQALDAQAAEIERIQQLLNNWTKAVADWSSDVTKLEKERDQLQAALDRSENSAHLLRTQLEGMRQELRDRDQELKATTEALKEVTNTYLDELHWTGLKQGLEQAKKELAEARQEAQEARKAAEWYSFMGSSIDEAQDALQSVYRFFRIATNAMNRDKEPKPETEPGNTFNDCTLIMSDCKEACGQCEALTREEQEQAASMEEVCSKMYQRFINRQ